MKHKTIQTNKVYEEKLNEELCNFNPQSFHSSDALETGRTRETMENTAANISHTNYTNSLNKETIFGVSSKSKNLTNNNNTNDKYTNNNSNLNKSSSREREKVRKSSRKSSKNSFRDSGCNLDPVPAAAAAQSPLLSLVDSLKEKLEFYENEVKSLIDEKITMQMTINNLQMQQMRKSTNNSRNSAKSKDTTVNNINKSALISDNNKALRISHESVFDLHNNSRTNEEKQVCNNNGNKISESGKNKLLTVDYNFNSHNNNNHNINENNFNKSFNNFDSRKNSNALSTLNNDNCLVNFDKDSLLINHQDNLRRQKKLLETNKSILEDTINVQNIKDFGRQDLI